MVVGDILSYGQGGGEVKASLIHCQSSLPGSLCVQAPFSLIHELSSGEEKTYLHYIFAFKSYKLKETINVSSW